MCVPSGCSSNHCGEAGNPDEQLHCLQFEQAKYYYEGNDKNFKCYVGFHLKLTHFLTTFVEKITVVACWY